MGVQGRLGGSGSRQQFSPIYSAFSHGGALSSWRIVVTLLRMAAGAAADNVVDGQLV